MLTHEKIIELVKMGKDIENSIPMNQYQLSYFLTGIKALTECLDVTVEKVKTMLLSSGFIGQEIVKDFDKKVMHMDGKITVNYATVEIFKAMEKAEKLHIFPYIVKVQKTMLEKEDNKTVQEICSKFSLIEKGNPYLQIAKLSKNDKINS